MGYDRAMQKPKVGKPRSASAMFTLSRRLPKLSLPASALPSRSAHAHPRIGKPAIGEHGPLPSMSAPPRPAAPVPTAAPPPAPPESVLVSEPAPSVAAPLPPPQEADVCTRCGHGEELHPVRYVCDRYPHADPLQICGCESESLEQECPTCGHKARAHKPRHRCRFGGCHCWGYEQVAAVL